MSNRKKSGLERIKQMQRNSQKKLQSDDETPAFYHKAWKQSRRANSRMVAFQEQSQAALSSNIEGN